MYIISIDLGKDSGAMTLLKKDKGNISVVNYLLLKNKTINKQIAFIKEAKEKFNLLHVISEQPYLNSKNQAASVPFVQLGWFKGICDLLGIDFQTFRPQVWQKLIKDVDIDPLIDSEYNKTNRKITKVKSLSYMKQHFPTIPYIGPKGGIKDGLADSICIGCYFLNLSNEQ
jgi:hypothetical protein